MLRRFGLLACLLFCLSWQALAKKSEPEVSDTTFKNIPTYVVYFDDSDTVIYPDTTAKKAYISKDAGVTWDDLKGVEQGEVVAVYRNPNDNQVGVVVGSSLTHWITRDQGATWKKFKTPVGPSPVTPAIVFHGSDSDRMLFNGAKCVGSMYNCSFEVYYTTTGFERDPKLLHDDAFECLWGKATNLLAERNPDMSDDRVLCISEGEFSTSETANRLLVSDDFFESEGTEPPMDDGRTVSGFIVVKAVNGYIVGAARTERSRELAMFVTSDTKTWHRAEFGDHKLENSAYTLLEGTNYSMQVDVLTSHIDAPIGALYTSNSNGTSFTKKLDHTNRNRMGMVDFEKIQNIQGIIIANIVENWEEVEESVWLEPKQVKTRISFDDGRTWHKLKVKNEELHLHSVTDQHNIGRIFSTPAPGIMMAVGNTGDYLKSYEKGDLYVSDDAGLTWARAQKGPHLYEFGDQGSILVAIENEYTDEIKWSVNHGADWSRMELDEKVTPIILTTTPDATSLKFILVAAKGRDSDEKGVIYAFDFEGLHERECEEDDFEEWYARVDQETKNPTCIMGHIQKFRRRSANAECFINEEFKDPVPQAVDCDCTEQDYECDYNFKLDDGKCVPVAPIAAPEGSCKGSEKTFMGPSGYRLIPGNTCNKDKKENLDDPVERDCKDTQKKPPTGDLGIEITEFKGSEEVAEYYYLERGENTRKTDGTNEVVVMRTKQGEVYHTSDHGKTWRPILKDEKVIAIYPHRYISENVYFVTEAKRVYYSANWGNSIGHFDVPELPREGGVGALTFHPTQNDWMIWTGIRDGKAIAHISTKGGENWEPLMRSVGKCEFVYREHRPDSESLVYCEQYEHEDPGNNYLILYSSVDWFEHKTELKRDVVQFATMAEYIVVAVRDDQRVMSVDSSIDGVTFADAEWPSNFEMPEDPKGYTVLDSSTHAVFLHVTINPEPERAYGSIMKSNSNGTNYVVVINEVNRNDRGYVDFEKMQGLEGVAVVNVVANKKDVDAGKAGKKLKTKITHNDGALWSLLTPPKKFGCSDNLEKCSLHLHGYTERKDPRDTYSSPSAVGLMIGVGNVGEYLGEKDEGDTFLTSDGGITWKHVAAGNWMWEYGDQGSILVVVKSGAPTQTLKYSLDEGATWIDAGFSEKDMVVSHITTVPSDTSRNFLLWGKIRDTLVTVNLDFSGLKERSERCALDEKNPDNDDYYLWNPTHPLSGEDCLFGHVAQYHRKRLNAECYNGKEIKHLHSIERNCSCTRRDFECDYNYQLRSDDTCELVPGLKAKNAKDYCKEHPDAIEYHDITGYRRIPITTCTGGKEYDSTLSVYPCDGHEPEFEKKHSLSGAGLFFAITIPIGAAAAVGYWFWRNWDGKFGRIQLGDGGSGMGGINAGGAFDRDAPWIKYPVLVLSGVVAILAALPMVVSSVYTMAMQRLGRSGGRYGTYQRPYTSRSSFARGRGDYAVVDPDEGELLGEDSDDGI